SRTMAHVARPEHLAAAAALRGALALLEQTAEARSIGIEPADPAAQRAVALEPRIEAFLRSANADRLETLARARALAAELP
ncbi:MAG TPA: hypothetical protein VJP76_07130, partial [Candidatus Tumulicola sp.]|nr:hypothetical protein [Candidatus Tumulicola sp.]